MPIRVVRPDHHALEKAGYASIAHVPFLFADDGHYPPEVNRYLRARALCEWELKVGTYGTPSQSRKRFLTEQSCWAMARRVATFLNWCETDSRDWRAVDYASDLIVWQRGLLSGAASMSKRGLDARTVNALIDEACYFLTWASEIPDASGEKPRSPFRVPTNSTEIRVSDGTRPHAGRKETVTRVGALKPRTSQLTIPSPTEVGRWMRAFRVRFPVKSLMAESVIEVGLRRSECQQIMVDTLPPKQDWKRIARAGMLPVWITHGVKGPKTSPGSSESARPREVLFPLELADRIDRYRSITRLTQIARWIRDGGTKDERDRRSRATKPSFLWLSESTNQPFASQQFYNAWVTCPGCPEGWHPHVGREYFAVESVVSFVRRDLDAHRSKSVPELSWLQGAMQDQVRLILSPLLGHVSDETTMIYLRAAYLRLVNEFGHPALRWQQFCDEDAIE